MADWLSEKVGYNLTLEGQNKMLSSVSFYYALNSTILLTQNRAIIMKGCFLLK